MDSATGFETSRLRSWFRRWWLCLVAGFSIGATAQQITLTLTNTASPVKLGTPLIYNLVVSNSSGGALLPGWATNVFPSSAQVLETTNSQGGTILTNIAGLVLFEILDFQENAVARIRLTLAPTQAGLFTNVITVFSPGSPPRLAATNAVTQVDLPEVDVSVSIHSLPGGVFEGDTFAWRLLATNSGPDTAPGVVVTNPLPSGVSFLSGSPAGQVSLVNTQILFSVGALSNGGSAEAIITVFADTAGSNLLSATIGATNVLDLDPTNDTFSTNLVILAPDTNVLISAIISDQTFQPQSGFMEQRIAVTNTGATPVDSFRVLVAGLTNALVNASGTNGGVPYVSHGVALASGDSVEMLLEHFNPTRLPGANPTLTAYPTPVPELTPGDGTPVPIARLVQLTNSSRVLIEFESTVGAVYQVLYASELGSNTFLGSLPEVTAGANRTQWMDYGPPRTTSAPDEASVRFYRVIRRQ